MGKGEYDRIGEVKVLRIASEFGGEIHEIFPVILADEQKKDGNILIDCGYPGFLPLLEDASEGAGVPLGSLSAIIVTHHDFDHAGALAELRGKYPHIRVMASEEEAPYIRGERRSPRLTQLEERYDSLSREERTEALSLGAIIAAVRPAPVDETLRGGDRFPWCGGAEIVATPGHLPGHISVYLPRHKTLIAGDALVVSEGRLRAANLYYAADAAEARRSARKLSKLDVMRVVCYHGGVVEGPIRALLR